MKVAIQAAIKDIYEPYLSEWLNHHRSIGVDYFFLYDNESRIPLTADRSDMYVEKISDKIPQLRSYRKCLADINSGALPFCDRVAFIDEDEFIICENNDIKETLSEYAEFSALGISWRMFGSSGLLAQTPEPQMKKFTHYAGPEADINNHIKSIVNPFLVKEALNPHYFSYTKGNCVNIDKVIIEEAFTKPIYRKLWINHYWTRSLEEWYIKVVRGRADSDDKRDLKMFDDLNSLCTEVL